MIYGIEGQFGSGKTSTAVKMADRYGPRAMVLTNIKVNILRKPNWHVFADDKLLEMLRVANAKNDLERMVYTEPRKDAPFPWYDRDKFTDTVVILDEAGAIANGRSWQEFDIMCTEYINQCRKMRADLIIVTADGSQVEYSLRRFVEDWIYVRPLLDWWIFAEIKVVRCRKKNKDGTILTEPFLARDDNGDWVQKERPLDWHLFWYFGWTTWDLYDDWHKNIRDPNKYDISDEGLAVLKAHWERDGLLEQGLILKGSILEARDKALIGYAAPQGRGTKAPSRFRKFPEKSLDIGV